MNTELKGSYNEGAYILALLGGIIIALQSLLWGFGFGMMGGGMMGGGMFGPTMGSRWMYDHMVEEMGEEFVQGIWWTGSGGLYSTLFGAFTIITIILGIVVLYGATKIRKGESKSGGTLVLVLGVLSIPFGAWLGGGLALIAGILALGD